MRRCKLTIKSTAISGTGSLSDFPVLFTAANLPADLFEAAQADGGDIFFTSDQAGVNRIPTDLVAYNPAGTAQIWVKPPSVNGSTDTDIWLWYGNTGQSQPAAGDTYGRNAVWSEAELAMLMESATPVDRTGNHTLDVTGTLGAITDGPFGAALNFPSGAGLSNNTDSDLYAILTTTNTTIEAVGRRWATHLVLDAAVVSFTGSKFVSIISHYRYSYNACLLWIYQDTTSGYFIPDSGIRMPYDQWAHMAFSVNSTNQEIYINGTSVGSAPFEIGAADPFTTFFVGGRFPDTQPWDGDIQSVFVWKTVRSGDWLATERSNQSDPVSFVDVGTPEDAGGVVPTLQSDLLSSWSSREYLAHTLQALYGTTAYFSASRQFLYDVLEYTDDDLSGLWDSLQVVDSDLSGLWDSLQFVEGSKTGLYEVLNQVTGEVVSQYKTLAFVENFREFQYRVLSHVQLDLDIKYNVLALAQFDLHAAYNVLAFIESLVQSGWDTGSITYLTKTLTSLWSTHQYISDDLSGSYNVLSNIREDIKGLFDVLTFAQADVQAQYQVRALVAQALEAQWRSLEYVQNQVQGLYQAQGSSSFNLVGKWESLQNIEAEFTGAYTSLVDVQKDINSVYVALNNTIDTLEAKYRVLKYITSNLNVKFRVGLVFDPTYRIGISIKPYQPGLVFDQTGKSVFDY